MASHTVATLPRLSATNLSTILLAASTSTSNLDALTTPLDIAIIDVRDDDHIGGHIKHSIHAPSQSLEGKIPELVEKLKDKKAVVFHCALSQQRGPSAALKYIRARQSLIGEGAVKLEPDSGVAETLKKNKEDELRKDKDENDDDWGGVNTVETDQQQKVYVLERGFVGWQEQFGEDTRLTEGYRKELWKDGYWM
ncbi:Uncharacterized protein BP5553_03248 [Venustampulla echinocandica]|uniref:Rhodanese domain-containing protein n=1 Tax=Venustampulla echinocandica TaxID=2656787 RepID=A0A370TTT7_9HELO|nr:Uncharacterized protein BP5553_03248 [Venustampulla echinocandica]RDL38908.1 Uncharacterized protein BP5553_03248 [Venustampulla echinocandica]